MNYKDFFYKKYAKARFDVFLRMNECFYIFVYINEKHFSHLKPDFYRKRRTNTPWVAPLSDEEKRLPPDQIGMRYSKGFKFYILDNLPGWMEKRRLRKFVYTPDLF